MTNATLSTSVSSANYHSVLKVFKEHGYKTGFDLALKLHQARQNPSKGVLYTLTPDETATETFVDTLPARITYAQGRFRIQSRQTPRGHVLYLVQSLNRSLELDVL